MATRKPRATKKATEESTEKKGKVIQEGAEKPEMGQNSLPVRKWAIRHIEGGLYYYECPVCKQAYWSKPPKCERCGEEYHE